MNHSLSVWFNVVIFYVISRYQDYFKTSLTIAFFLLDFLYLVIRNSMFDELFKANENY